MEIKTGVHVYLGVRAVDGFETGLTGLGLTCILSNVLRGLAPVLTFFSKTTLGKTLAPFPLSL